MNLSDVKTCDLVSELRQREGVETHIAEPYQDVTVSVNGPAVVLVVIDQWHNRRSRIKIHRKNQPARRAAENTQYISTLHHLHFKSLYTNADRQQRLLGGSSGWLIKKHKNWAASDSSRERPMTPRERTTRYRRKYNTSSGLWQEKEDFIYERRRQN